MCTAINGRETAGSAFGMFKKFPKDSKYTNSTYLGVQSLETVRAYFSVHVHVSVCNKQINECVCICICVIAIQRLRILCVYIYICIHMLKLYTQATTDGSAQPGLTSYVAGPP